MGISVGLTEEPVKGKWGVREPGLSTLLAEREARDV